MLYRSYINCFVASVMRYRCDIPCFGPFVMLYRRYIPYFVHSVMRYRCDIAYYITSVMRYRRDIPYFVPSLMLYRCDTILIQSFCKFAAPLPQNWCATITQKLVHRYWVDVLGVLRGPRASSLQSFRCSSSFLHIDSWQKVLKKQILPYYGAANGRCGKTGP